MLALAGAVAAAGSGAAAALGGAPAASLLRIPLPQDDGSLTPYSFELGYPLVTLIYDTLLWRDDDGVAQPWLARSVSIDAAGTHVSVRLADGVRWQDGTPLTAADVAFTFRFVADHPHPRFTPEVQAIARVDAVDDTTAVFTLSRPSPGFDDQPLADVPILPMHLWASLPPGTLAPAGLPVGSGPYRLVSHEPGVRYRFEANTGYFRGAPAVAAIEVPVIADAEASVRALQRRDVDVLPVSLGRTDVDRVKAFGLDVAVGPSYAGTSLAFNTRAPPFDRVEVRRALAGAIDLDELARTVGDAVPADRGYLHPDSAWAPPDVLHTPDPSSARRVLGSFGLPALDVVAPDNEPIKVQAASAVAAAWRGLGLVATARVVPRDEYRRAVGLDGSSPAFEAAIVASSPLASYDPDALARSFGSDPAVANLDYSGYRSAAFDSAAALIATTADTGARKAAVGDALRVVAADAPELALFFSDGAYAYRASVYDGWRFVKGTGIIDKRSFVEPRAPEPSTSATAAGPARSAGPGGGSGWGPLGIAALSCAAAAAVVAGVATVRRLR